MRKTKIQHTSILNSVEEVKLDETGSIGVDLPCVAGNSIQYQFRIDTFSKSHDENRVLQRLY